LLNSQLQQIKNNLNSYKKPHLTFTKQIELLKSKGLNISNDAYAKKKLSNINYYRLSAYFLPFQYPKSSDKSDIFYDDAEFREIVSLYDFDAKLRRLVFGALEVIEVYIRTQITYYHTQAYTPFGYLSQENFNCESDFFEKLKKDIKEESGRSDEEFVAHFKNKYNTTDLPLWSVVETLSLTTISRLFTAMKVKDKKIIAEGLGVNQKVLANWLHALTILRNICAHHSRLWNKQLRIQFLVPKSNLFAPIKNITKIRYKDGKEQKVTYTNNASVFFALSTIKYMLDGIGEEVDFVVEVKQLIAEHPIVNLEAMGFINDWENLEIWSDV
jgi:abortive infection bacteriophage resistance protein